ncbi:restriction endonuclease subunit S [Aliarcobacter skirrowii]|uniref:restriction endonuclease subunit S n=1 Tax=Aliarcobacter skirrowii TaxID=28200 RepID=UPI0029BA2F9D|nr:restriction endonuclease subunit S [Aliarcobacter skirrowii]MDX4047699.1 restriction endonuclease subunit S [Aliarcobacter skirrowii]
MSNVPKLRFKEFSGKWEKKTVGDVGKVSMCKRILKDQTTSDGDIPFYKIGTFGKEPDAFISKEIFEEFKAKYSFPKEGEILISASGTIGRTVIYDGSPSYFQDSNIVWIANNEKLALNKFLLYCYENTRWNTENTTIARLYNENLRNIPLILPSKQEQEKIALFFTSIDTKIEQLSKKEELLQQYKKGVMQKIFNQEIRFKADDGSEFCEWGEKKLDDILKTVSTKLYQIKSSDILSEGLFKVVDQGQKTIAGYSNDTEKVYSSGDIIVYGDHTTIVKYIDFDFIVGADGTKLLNTTKDNNLKYMYYNLVFNNIEAEGYKRHFSILRNITLQIPSLKEQIKIANFLSSIDSKIEQVQKQLNFIKEFKKALLQQMFV